MKNLQFTGILLICWNINPGYHKDQFKIAPYYILWNISFKNVLKNGSKCRINIIALHHNIPSPAEVLLSSSFIPSGRQTSLKVT